MTRRTPLYAEHLAAGARIVDFAGWDMPLHYGSQIDEHHQVRRAAGMFDVSHMGVVEVSGARSREFLRFLLANDVARLKQPGAALYTCMLNPQGGVMDDLIVYYLGNTGGNELFRIVVNAATRDKDIAWMCQQAQPFGVGVVERIELSIIAVQGPAARERVYGVLTPTQREAASQLAPFHAALVEGWLIARTGYTGEDGFELIVPGDSAPAIWRALLGQGIKPCGLGARDTLRLEAGLNLYGNDMDETTSPLETGLAWTVAWEKEGPQRAQTQIAQTGRDFIGRAPLEAERHEGSKRQRVGLVLEGKGVLRRHQKVIIEGGGEGEITSGGFAPTLNRSIALALVPAGIAPGHACQVEIRGQRLPARVVKPPFVRHGHLL